VTDLEIPAGTVRCRVCRVPKAPEDFYQGQGKTCKECSKSASKVWRKNNPVRYRANRTSWEKDNLELARKRRLTRLKRRYKISKERIEELLKAQDFKCAICKVPLHSPGDLKPKKETAKPIVDHSHEDGHVRGILCSACNVALGLLEDDLVIIKAAYQYIKRDQSNSALRD
jgi:hypothetical protein